MATGISERPKLEPFRGLYTAPDAARYIKATMPSDSRLSMDSAKIQRWVRKGVADPSYKGRPASDVVIDFEDLVSMRVVAALRAVGVAWSAIREAERWLRDHTGASKPFATATLWHGAGDVYSEWAERLIAASRHGQAAFDLLRGYITPISGLAFDETTNRAALWRVNQHVMLNPKIHSGAPCIAGTRVPTRSIVGAIEAGDRPEFVRDAYGISTDALESAIEWESRIQFG